MAVRHGRGRVGGSGRLVVVMVVVWLLVIVKIRRVVIQVVDVKMGRLHWADVAVSRRLSLDAVVGVAKRSIEALQELPPISRARAAFS